MKTIVAAVDFSPATELVIAHATELARTLPARIVLLHVTEPAVGVIDFAVISMSVAEINETALARAKHSLGEIKDRLTSTGLEVDILQVVGSPGREVIDQSQELSADYIVLGSHGHTILYDLVVGSTTNVVLKHARCPVVIVPVPPSLRRRAAKERVLTEAGP